MKQKRLLSMFTILTMLIALLPNITVSADINSETQFERVTSAEEITTGVKYLIVGCSGNFGEDGAKYYTMADYEYSSVEAASGYRSALPVVYNDGIITLDESNAGKPLALSFEKYSEGKYILMTDDTHCLNGAYSTGSTTYDFDSPFSKSLPALVRSYVSHISKWTPIFRSDGTVLFETSRNSSSAYIRLHHKANNGGVAVFSGGELNDSYIDLPEDGSLTYTDLGIENIPVKTYLYKEVCTHSEEYLTHTEEKASTCSEHGNIEYYYCSYCHCYLLSDKTTEIALDDTISPLVPHTNTEIVPAKKATCTEHGNIEYTICKDCGGYFEGNSTEMPIDISETGIPTINHSYVDGKCSVCGADLVTSYFGHTSSGDGSHCIFVAEYDNKMYAMGMPNGKGMDAVEISEIYNVFKASNDTVAFVTLEGGDDTSKYIKIGQNYLKNDLGNLKFACEKEYATYWSCEYGNMYDNTDSQKYICLITNDGDPYFSVSDTIGVNHIKAYEYLEKCHHKSGLVQSPYVEPTCYTNGMREYWTCNVCEKSYFDSKGISEIWNKDDLIILALGAKDENGDDVCDYCGKNMPILTKVTSADEIVMQNKYILVAEYGGCYYAMAPIASVGKEEKGGLSDNTLLPAVQITPLEDGTFKYKNADDQNAFIFTTEFASDCSELDNGEIRYSLQGMVDGKLSSLLDSNGCFEMREAYAKYGYRIGLDDDGTAKIQSVYNETWVGTESGYLRFYRMDGQYGFSILEKENYNGTGMPYEGVSIDEAKVYLYRMTENGTVTNPENSEQSVSYTLNDVSSTRNFTKLIGESPTTAENAAANVSIVSGMSEALKQEAINNVLTGFVEDWSTQSVIKLDMDVNISVKDYIEGNEKEGIDSSITFSLTPTLNITDGTKKGTINIDDSSFNGSKLMNVSIYVGNMDPQEIIHIKQDGTKEYFYPSWHAKVESGEAKSFDTLYSSTGNWVIFSVTEFSDIIVNNTESIFSIDLYDQKEGMVTLSCAEDGEYTVVFAHYEKNALKDVKFVPKKCSVGINYEYKPKDIEISAGDKIFLWGKDLNMEPLCEAYPVE